MFQVQVYYENAKNTKYDEPLLGVSCNYLREALAQRIKLTYRKRPCISHTFFHKIEAQNQGCGLSSDTSVLGVLKHPN